MRALSLLTLAACTGPAPDSEPDPSVDTEADTERGTEGDTDGDTAAASSCRVGVISARSADGATWRGTLDEHPLELTRTAAGDWRGQVGSCVLAMRRNGDALTGSFDGVPIRGVVLSEDIVRMRVGDTPVDLRNDGLTWRGSHPSAAFSLRSTDELTWRGTASPPVLALILAAIDE